ncbi:MAG: queuosine precursor transporter [Clostridia bacterium]|nr:queuosine precursor transporter [Clostridia bacterium]
MKGKSIMNNELLLVLSVFVVYGGVLLVFRFFSTDGLCGFMVLATVCANIEVLLLIEAFGIEQTLGNVMFASTFLITDILNETAGKRSANRAVNLGIFTSVMFILLSQMWLAYDVSANDYLRPSFAAIFSQTPRVMLAGLVAYAASQKLDVYLYRRIWALTTKKFGDSERFLWLRNNGATLIAQLVNTLLFTFGAFWGVYPQDTMMQIVVWGYVIYIITSLLDTPAVYMARKLAKTIK